MNQNNGMQKRMLIMTLVVFVFFIAYEFLVLKPQQEARAQKAKEELAQKQNAAPDVNTVAAQTLSTDVNGNPVDMSKSADALSSKAIASSQIVSVIKTAKNVIEIDTLGRVAQVTLLEKKYKDENTNQIKLLESNQLRPLEVRFADANLNTEAFKVNVIASSSNVDATTQVQELILTQNLTNSILTKKFTIYPDGHYDLTVSTTNDKQFFISNGFRPNVLADMYAVHGFISKLNDNTL
jgi:YidC/Oxa1 family membrane protein insertase